MSFTLAFTCFCNSAFIPSTSLRISFVDFGMAISNPTAIPGGNHLPTISRISFDGEPILKKSNIPFRIPSQNPLILSRIQSFTFLIPSHRPLTRFIPISTILPGSSFAFWTTDSTSCFAALIPAFQRSDPQVLTFDIALDSHVWILPGRDLNQSTTLSIVFDTQSLALVYILLPQVLTFSQALFNHSHIFPGNDLNHSTTEFMNAGISSVTKLFRSIPH